MQAKGLVRTVGWVLPLLTVGCMVRLDSCGLSSSSSGHNVSSRNGRLTVDGVELAHDRWVEVQLDVSSAAPLAIRTTTGPVELAGDPEGDCALSVHVYSQLPDDGEVYLNAGRLDVRSQQNAKVFIDGVRGTVPESLSLRLDSTSGDVSVRGAAKGGELLIDTTSGDILVEGSEPGSLSVDSTSGDVRVEQSSSPALLADTTSGDIALVGGSWGEIRVESVSGDVKLTDCTADELKLGTTSGDLIVSGGHLQRARVDTVSGDVDLLDGAMVDLLDED